MKTLSLTPALGRDYKNKKTLLADWKSDKDFVAHFFTGNTGYANRSAIMKYSPDITHVELRYDQQRKVAVVPITMMERLTAEA